MSEAQDAKGKPPGRSKFPLGAPPPLPDVSFNPFVNHSIPLSSPWEVVRTVLMLPIVFFRILVFIAAFFIAFLVANLALIGATNIFTKPFPVWRRNLLWPVSWCVRMVLFALGYNYIEVRGKVARRDVAPILVGNHVTSIDPLYMFMAHLPMIVTAKENLNIPVAGVVMKALQVVLVDRASPTSRRDAAGEIKRRAMCNDWAHVVLFPEATTTNGRALVSFKTGAFAPGLPVQPVVIQYPHTNFDPSWVADGMPTPLLIFRMMSNLNNQMIVEYLDPVFPTERETTDSRLYAERVRMIMAKALNVNTTEHAFGDVALALEAQKLKMPRGVGNIEFGRLERLFKLDLKEAKGYLRRFKDLDVTKRGQLSLPEFLAAMDLPDTEFTRSVFSMFDTNEDGVINFREFVAGLLFISRHPQFHDSVKEVFEKLDTDKDGKVSAEDAKTSLAKEFPTFSPSQLETLFNTLGLNKKDHLSWEEFESFLKLHPEYLALTLASTAANAEG